MHHFSSQSIQEGVRPDRAREWREPPATLRIAVIVAAGYSLLEVGMIAEVVSKVIGGEQSGIEMLNVSSNQVASASGMIVSGTETVDLGQFLGSFESLKDMVFICSGSNIDPSEETALLRLIRHLMRRRQPICATGAIVKMLVEKKFVDAATDHWNRLVALSEASQHATVSNAIFVTDGRVTTCAGELGLMDFLLVWLKQKVGGELATVIARQFVSPPPRFPSEAQPARPTDFKKGLPVPVLKAVEMMFDGIEDLVSIQAIAEAGGISNRQLERLFQKHFGTPPAMYYKRIRLEHSLALLSQTDLSLTEIALACGFSSQSNFRKNFAREFGLKPSKMRAGLKG